jgi:hypothetical protein
MKKYLGVAVLAAMVGAGNGYAEDAADINGITAQDLLKLLIDEGIVDPTKVKALAEKVKARQRDGAGAVETVAAEHKDAKPAEQPGVVRVPYVPQYIRDQIRDEVRIGLKEDVSRDVMAQAKQERWGLPGALPEWVGRIKLSGDIRLREESTFFADANMERDYLDVARINAEGSVDLPGDDAFLNTTEDRNRLRARLRLAMKAKISERFEAGARLVTGNQSDPVSTNQTLGNYDKKWQTTFDLGYLRYSSMAKSVIVSGGRFENPFFNTDLVWDSDLSFEGLAASWWWLRGGGLNEEFRSFDPFVTVGAFPLQEIERSGDDKWLYSAQTGFQYEWANQNRLTAALAYHSYDNIVGRRNAPGQTELDYTAPAFLQKGNTLFEISNNLNANDPHILFGHAVDYQLVDALIEYDLANLAPIHVLLTLNYVKNLGFDEKDVASRVGIEIDEKTDGYLARVAVGWPVISKARDWQVSFTYRYLERDAVLAAFTDSDFHLGGTDAEGYVLRFDYGIADNTWMSLRWLSANEIDGNSYPEASGTGKFGVDTLQLDVNAKF